MLQCRVVAVIGFASVSIFAAACGGSSGVASQSVSAGAPSQTPIIFTDAVARRVGQCPAGAAQHGELAPAELQLSTAAAWTRTASIAIQSRGVAATGSMNSFASGAAVPSFLGGNATLAAASDVIARASQVRVAAKSYLIATYTPLPLASAPAVTTKPQVRFLAAVDGNGNTIFYGGCEYESLTLPLRLFAASHHLVGGAEQLLQILVGDPKGQTARAFNAGWPSETTPATQPSWSQLPPSQRNVGPGDTPDDLLKVMQNQMVLLTVPLSWAATPWLACVKSGEGWGDCTEISQSTSVSPDKSTFLFGATIYFDPGQGYDLVLKDGPRFTDPIVSLLSIDSTTASKGSSISVQLSGTPSDPKAQIVNP